MRKIAVFCLLWMVFSLKTNAQEACCHNNHNNMSADQLMTLVVNKAKANDSLKRAKLIYTANTVREDLDYAGNLRSTERTKKTIDGKSRKLAGFDLGIGELLQVLTEKDEFNFASQTETTYNGRRVIIIEFHPKNDLISSTTEDKFINRLRGKLLIDAQNYSLWQVVSHIPDDNTFNFRAWWLFFFVTIEVNGFSLDFQQIDYRGIMVENIIEVEAKFNVLNSTRSRKYHYRYENYRVK